MIQGINGKAFVKFVVYSVPNGAHHHLLGPDREELHQGAHRDAASTSRSRRAARKQIEYATDGQDVWVTRTVKDKSGA